MCLYWKGIIFVFVQKSLRCILEKFIMSKENIKSNLILKILATNVANVLCFWIYLTKAQTFYFQIIFYGLCVLHSERLIYTVKLLISFLNMCSDWNGWQFKQTTNCFHFYVNYSLVFNRINCMTIKFSKIAIYFLC